MRAPSPRRLAAVAIAASTALLSSVVPASAECASSVATCNTDHDEYRATTASLGTITTVLPLRGDNLGLSRELYTALIPAPYTLPSQIGVGVQVNRLDVPRQAVAGLVPQQGTITSTVAIRVSNAGVEGWYPISSVTTSATAVTAARADGQPSNAGTATFGADAISAYGTTKVGTQPAVSLVWNKDTKAPLAGLGDYSFHRIPTFSLSGIFSGPSRIRVQEYLKPLVPVNDVNGSPVGLPVALPPEAAPVNGQLALGTVQKGYVAVDLGADVNALNGDLPDLPFGDGHSLSDLVSVKSLNIGTFLTHDVTIVTQVDDLDDGSDGTVPNRPGIPGQGVVVSGNPQNFYNTFIVLPQGSSLTLVNADPASAHSVTQMEPPGGIALFESDTVDAGGTALVKGVETLPRDRYTFVCSLHSGMLGQLFIV